ncbi:hypothetical protein [Microbacterium sp. 3J1]|uniref:hypothetical protein n=1 Tax=Microbacterium sp. 3J1 TaxID=861269 RepID=UPI000A8CBE1E|nr:hypothetical protein [Microbacterium sp. 3J1]
MVDLRARTHGAGATRAVNLVVLAYDERVAAGEDGEVTTHYLDARVHPGDRRAPGETDLALVRRTGARAISGFDNSAAYSPTQLASIEEAAGPNVTELTDPNGAIVGRGYGVRADLLIAAGHVVVNTRTVEPTALSVAPDGAGRDIRSQIVASMSAARRARESAGTAGGTGADHEEPSRDVLSV